MVTYDGLPFTKASSVVGISSWRARVAIDAAAEIFAAVCRRHVTVEEVGHVTVEEYLARALAAFSTDVALVEEMVLRSHPNYRLKRRGRPGYRNVREGVPRSWNAGVRRTSPDIELEVVRRLAAGEPMTSNCTSPKSPEHHRDLQHLKALEALEWLRV